MEDISPTLHLSLIVRTALENGHSVRTGVRQFLSLSHDPFVEVVSKWLLFVDQEQSPNALLENLHPYRRALLLLLDKGLKGLPVLTHLIVLEEEIIQSCELEMETQIQKLPLLIMLPLFLLMFPAYLILLFGPIIQSLLMHTGP